MGTSGGFGDRRRFLKALGVLAVGTRTFLHSGSVEAAARAAREEAAGVAAPPMTFRKLGRTGFQGSRLVFGCGAALSRSPNDPLLRAAFDAGVNVFDVGSRRYYRDAERNLGPFIRSVRDEVFLISKAMVYLEVEPEEEIGLAQSRQAAHTWQSLMDDSLRELGVDHVNAYYLMAAHNPWIVKSDELFEVFLRAKRAGKVDHLGLSTHQNAERVLEAAIDTGRYALAQIAITPAGWYDWAEKGILAKSPPMTGLAPLLARARKAGIGLIGMKAGRYLAGRKFLGWGKPTAFDAFYDEAFLRSGLSAFQRSYAFVLEHGLDAVNADMQQIAHLQENLVAATTSRRHFS